MKRIVCHDGSHWLAIAIMLLLAVGHAPALAEQAGDQPTDLSAIEVLDIETAAQIALSANPSLAAARERVIQAREAVRQARSAYWPRLDLGASGARVSTSDQEFESQLQSAELIASLPGGPPVDVDQDNNVYNANLTASWILFDGFARRFNLAAAKFGAQSSAASQADAQRLLLAAVIGSYLNAQLALESVSITKADESFNQRQFSEAKLRYEVGTGALSDVLNFEVRANSAKSERIVAERVYETSRIALAALLGIDKARLPEQVKLAMLSPATETELEKPLLDEQLERAYAQRPDLEVSDWSVQQAQALVKSARAEYWPTLTVSGKYEGQRLDDAGFESEDFGNSVALGLSYNIFAGGFTYGKHHQAKARLRELELTQQNAKINITSEVQSVIATVDSAQQQLLLQRQNAKLVQRNRDLVEKEYKAGVGSLVRLNEAQRDLIRAQVSLATSRAALRRAWYDLETSTGQIVETFRR